MDNEWVEINARLDELWDLDNGFFWKLRDGEFNQGAYEELCQVLRAIPKNVESYPVSTIKLLWKIPHFMTTQQDRVTECSQLSVGQYTTVVCAVIMLLEDIWPSRTEDD